jgi:hypothetical protein
LSTITVSTMPIGAGSVGGLGAAHLAEHARHLGEGAQLGGP